MLQHKLQQAHILAHAGRQLPVRPAAVRPTPRLLTARVQAAADLGALNNDSNASSCPFLATTASLTSVSAPSKVPEELAGLHGPEGTWRVLPNGNTPQLPEPVGRWAWNPLLGEYGEMERKGMGPFLVERYKDFGPVFTWKIGPEKVVAIMDYEVIRSLLKVGDSRVVVAWNPEAMYAMLGEGARRSLENVEFRKNSRKHLAPGFSREALRYYMSTLVDICRDQLDAWSAAPGPIDLSAEGKNLSFEFSTQLLVDFKVPAERKAELREKFARLFTGMVAPPIRLPGTRFSQGLAARAELIEEIKGLMAARQKGPRKSVLDYTLDSKTEMQGSITDTERAEGGMGLIIAGNDTSGLGVTALLAILPLFPEVMQKLRQEQEQLIQRHGAELTVNVLDEMHYSEAVIKEVLRVAPPSGLVMRRTLVDMEICGKFVPAGSILHLSTFLGQVLTDPRLDITSYSEEDLRKLYENWALITQHTLSADFNPDRWLQPDQPPPPHSAGSEAETLQAQAEADLGLKSPDSSEGCPFSSSSSSSDSGLHKPSGLLTFSVGPHACLGYSLFMAEAKVLLALLARGYSAEAYAPQSLNFKTKFLTLLQQGSVKFSKHEQPLPFSAREHVPHSVAAAAAAAAAAKQQETVAA